MKRVVISLSGGMDSTSLLLHLLRRDYEVYTLFFNYGQKHKIEFIRLKKNLSYLRKEGYKIKFDVIDLSILGKLYRSALLNKDWKIPEGHYQEDNMKDTVVPNRNAIFASIIFGYALSLTDKNKIVDIALGVHSGDHSIYPDCRPEFYQELEKVFILGNWDANLVRFYLPYLELDKHRILIDALNTCKILNIDFNKIFKNTNTCYNPQKGKSCGKCGSCSERLEAFNKLGLKDPVFYKK